MINKTIREITEVLPEFENTFVRTLKNKPKTLMRYLTWKQKKELMRDINDSAVILFEYYLSRSGDEDFDFNDEAVAHSLDWSPRKVGKLRRALTKAGWFLQVTYSNKNHTPILLTLLGKEVIWKHKK